MEELPAILWAYRTTPTASTGETPFMLAYGTEAVIPVELGCPSLWVEKYDESFNTEGLMLNLDLLDEKRDEAIIRNAIYKKRTANYNNKHVRPRNFQKGDLVLRETAASDPNNTGKLMPK